jgi:uncharacterized protein
VTRPTPIPVPWDREFWANAERGVMSAQRCQDCGRLQHYPKPVCSDCLSPNLVFEPLSGRATVWSFTTIRQPENPDFRPEAPYTLLDVEFEEGIRMVSRLADEAEAKDLRIGDQLRAVFKPVGDGSRHLPYFERVHEPRLSRHVEDDRAARGAKG